RLGRQELRLTLVLATTIVVLACVNIAGLGIARRRHRAREYAMRKALGASGWDLARLTLCEVAVLSATGTVVGLWMTNMVMAIVAGWIPAYIVVLKSPSIDWRVVAICAAASVATIGCAVLAAVFAREDRLRSVTGHGTAVTPRTGWSGTVLVSLQVG